MPVTVYQLHDESLTESAAPSERKATHRWQATGSETTSTILTAIALALPSTYLGMYLQRYDPVHQGGGVWNIDVSYGPLEPLATTGYQLQFKTTGGSTKAEQSLETVEARDVDGATFTDTFGGLIGVNGDKVEGADIIIPQIEITVTKKFAAATLASQYLNDLVDLTGRTNEETFTLTWLGLTFEAEAGEALFKGANVRDGGKESDGTQLIEVTLEFGISRNAVGLAVGAITGIDKKGWELIWVRYQDGQSAGTAPVYTKKPLIVYVEKMYEAGDFALLGLES